MIRRPPRSTRTDTLFPYTTLFRSVGLAERWTVTGDGRSYIFRVREARWSNGDKVTAEAVAAILRSYLGRRSKHVLKDDFPEVETRSEEHTSELQSLMRISYAVVCWKKNHD